MTTDIRQTTIAYNGAPLTLEYFLRPGSQSTILYLHGIGCSKDDFTAATQEDTLSAYTIIGLDFPGHGGSSYAGHLDIDDLVEITMLFMQQLQLKSVILVGHSMGGLVGLLFSHKYPRNVRAFVNVEGNLDADDCFITKEIAKYSFADFLNHGFDAIKGMFIGKSNAGFTVYVEHLQNVNPQAYHDYAPSMTEYSINGNLLQMFESLPMPRLFIYGEQNNSLKYIEDLRAHGVDVAEIAGSNHWPGYDNPKEYYPAIARFFPKIFNTT